MEFEKGNPAGVWLDLPATKDQLHEAMKALNITSLNPQDLKRFLDYPDNTDCFVYVPGVLDYKDLGDYYLNDSGMVQMPEEWKYWVDREDFGRNAAAQEQGHFTEQGYLVLTGDEWQVDFEENGVPDKYRVMSFPE